MFIDVSRKVVRLLATHHITGETSVFIKKREDGRMGRAEQPVGMMFGKQALSFRLDGAAAELLQQGPCIFTALQSHVTGIETGHPGLDLGFTGPRGTQLIEGDRKGLVLRASGNDEHRRQQSESMGEETHANLQPASWNHAPAPGRNQNLTPIEPIKPKVFISYSREFLL